MPYNLILNLIDESFSFTPSPTDTRNTSAEPLSFTNISGGAAPILASVIGVSPKTWRILAHRDYKRIEAASRDELRDKFNKSNGGQI